MKRVFGTKLQYYSNDADGLLYKVPEDFVLPSDRDAMNTQRLAENWRPITEGIFREFKQIQFVVYHQHDQAKINLPENVDVVTP